MSDDADGVATETTRKKKRRRRNYSKDLAKLESAVGFATMVLSRCTGEKAVDMELVKLALELLRGDREAEGGK
jgi:hypothetical protein